MWIVDASPSSAGPAPPGRSVTVTRRAPSAKCGVKNSLVDTLARWAVHWLAAIWRISSARAWTGMRFRRSYVRRIASVMIARLLRKS